MVHYNYAGRMINIKTIHQEIFSGSFKFWGTFSCPVEKRNFGGGFLYFLVAQNESSSAEVKATSRNSLFSKEKLGFLAFVQHGLNLILLIF